MDLRHRISAKLNSNKGISLAELLVTIIFCLMTFALVVTAITAAHRHLRKSTMQSEARMLCSTLTISTEDVLRYAGSGDGTASGGTSAGSIEGTSGDSKDGTLGSIVFYSGSQRGQGQGCYFKKDDNGHILFMHPKDTSSGGGSGSDMLSADMAPASAYTQGMEADMSLVWHPVSSGTDSTAGTFTGTITITDGSGNTIASQSFAVAPVNINTR